MDSLNQNELHQSGEKSSVGAIIGILIIVIIIILGALYIFGTKTKDVPNNSQPIGETELINQNEEALNNATVEEDLGSIDVPGLEGQIEAL